MWSALRWRDLQFESFDKYAVVCPASLSICFSFSPLVLRRKLLAVEIILVRRTARKSERDFDREKMPTNERWCITALKCWTKNTSEIESKAHPLRYADSHLWHLCTHNNITTSHKHTRWRILHTLHKHIHTHAMQFEKVKCGTRCNFPEKLIINEINEMIAIIKLENIIKLLVSYAARTHFA